MAATQRKPMAAVVVEKQGPPSVLRLVPDWPAPRHQHGHHVLVQQSSTSVNPVDVQIRSGSLNKQLEKTNPELVARIAECFPKVLGGDVAGVVVAATEGSKFKPGDAVIALTYGYWIESREGSYCEYVIVPEDFLAHAPISMPLSQAGAIPLVGLTAWQALTATDPQPGQTVLVHAGAGGVGHIAVQLAKAWGLHVVATAGPDNAAFVRDELGADVVINYHEDDFAELYKHRPFDIVIDCVPGYMQRSLSVLKPSGWYSHIQNQQSEKQLLYQMKYDQEQGTSEGPHISYTLVQPNGQQLAQLVGLIDEGKVRVVVSASFPLDQAAQAHELVESGHTRGKVVLTMGDMAAQDAPS